MQPKEMDLSFVERRPAVEGWDSMTLRLVEALRILPGRREVYRGQIAGSDQAVVAKLYLTHPKQARDWRREWGNLLALAGKGFPVPEPVAVCVTEDGCVCVLMQWIKGAETLGRYLETAGVAERQDAMRALVELVDRLHAQGARQMDQHIDNWAVAQGQLYLLDAGSYRISDNALGGAERLEDLAAICSSLPPLAENDFRAALSDHYWQDDSAPASRGDWLGGQLDSKIDDVQQARARRYFKKTQRECTEFGEFTNARWQGMFAKSANADLIQRFSADPESLMAEGKRLKSGNTCTVQKLGAHVLKRYNKKSKWVQLRRSFKPSRGRTSWSNGWVLDLSFIPTARPVAFAEARGFPRGQVYLLMETLDGQLMPDYVDRMIQSGLSLEPIVEQVGQIWDRLGRLRAVHGDLKATNWIVGDEGQVFLFDLDSLQFGLAESSFQKGRQKDLDRFLQNWTSKPDIARAFSARMQPSRL